MHQTYYYSFLVSNSVQQGEIPQDGACQLLELAHDTKFRWTCPKWRAASFLRGSRSSRFVPAKRRQKLPSKQQKRAIQLRGRIRQLEERQFAQKVWAVQLERAPRDLPSTGLWREWGWQWTCCQWQQWAAQAVWGKRSAQQSVQVE